MTSDTKNLHARNPYARNSYAKNPNSRDLAQRLLARFGAMAALILIGAVVFYGR